MADLYSVFEHELDKLKQDNQYRFLKSISSKNDKFVIPAPLAMDDLEKLLINYGIAA